MSVFNLLYTGKPWTQTLVNSVDQDKMLWNEALWVSSDTTRKDLAWSPLHAAQHEVLFILAIFWEPVATIM